jgi:hypothetical protein
MILFFISNKLNCFTLLPYIYVSFPLLHMPGSHLAVPPCCTNLHSGDSSCKNDRKSFTGKGSQHSFWCRVSKMRCISECVDMESKRAGGSKELGSSPCKWLQAGSLHMDCYLDVVGGLYRPDQRQFKRI